MTSQAQAFVRENRFALLGGWMVLLGLGAVSVVAQPVMSAYWGALGKQTLRAMLVGDVPLTLEGLGAFAFYVTVVTMTPMVVLGGFVLIERRLERNDRSSGNDSLAWLVQALFISSTIGLLMILAQFELRPEPLIELDRSAGPFAYWLQLIGLFMLALLIGDFLGYWLHRAQHRYACLWRFHAVHHSQDLDVLRNINHPVEQMMNFFLVAVPAGMLVRVDPTEVLLLAAFFSIQGRLNHVRAPINLGPLGLFISDNRYHFVHHSRDPADYNMNFANRFPFIDMVFGTYNGRREMLPVTGVLDHPAPATVMQHLLGTRPAPPGDAADRSGVPAAGTIEPVQGRLEPA